nr:MAG TPA: head to tail connecting protein [Caudoviricetes sp.]
MPVDLKQLNQIFAGLKKERSGWETLWRDIRDYEVPDLGCFEGEAPWDGGKRYQRLYDAEAAEAADIMAAGLLSGLSSPSRPWLRLTTMDPELDAQPDVEFWLSDLQQRFLMRFAKSEVYNSLHRSYLELTTFGTACSIIQGHPDNVIDMLNLSCGEYWLGSDPYGRVDTLFRKFSMTAKQMVQRFGYDRVSNDVKSLMRTNPFERKTVIQAIVPRMERDIFKRDKLNKPYASVYWEEGRDSDPPLEESGFDEFPALCPRWLVTGGSVYGRGPGAKALSASKSLQRLHNRLATMTDYITNPPVQFPTKHRAFLDMYRPGGRIPVDPGDNESIRTAWEVKADPALIDALIERRRQEIQRYFKVNIFQMIEATQVADRTATEIEALNQEKIMVMGPILERLHTELLDPLVSNAFALMVEKNQVPPAPEALHGKPLSIEYISVLAEQQKASSVNGILNTVQQIGVIAQLKPDVLDKLDADKAVDLLADMNNVPPSMIVSGQQIALIRQQRAEDQAAMQQQAMAAQSATTLKDLGQAADSAGLREIDNGQDITV